MFYIISEMVSLGSIINACDLTGKTALHYAVMYGFFECVIILLYELASPFKRDFDGKLPSHYAKDLKTHIALKRAELLHFFHSIRKQWNFEKNVRSGLLFLLKYELHEEFNAEKYCLVNRDIMKF
jgi:ankyrin repeat protein